MNRKHLFVIGLLILIVIFPLVKMCKGIKLEGFGNIVVSQAPTETKIVKFIQPKQSDVLNVTTSDGQQHNGAIAYKVGGAVPEYQTFPVPTEQCQNTYSTTSKQQYITSYLYGGKLAFTSDKVNSNVYLGLDSEQSWSIVVADNSTNTCAVYITSNTQDVGLNPPYYLEVEAPKNSSWGKKIMTTTVAQRSDATNGIYGDIPPIQGRIAPSVKVTTIKNDINALWIIEKVDGLKFLQSDFKNLMSTVFEFLEMELRVSHDERKQFIQTMIEALKPVVTSSSTLDNFIDKIDAAIPNNAALATFGINGTSANPDPHKTVVDMLSIGLNNLDYLYQIKSLPFNLYLTSNKGDGTVRELVTLSTKDYIESANTFWFIKPTDGTTNTPIVEGFDVAKFVKEVSAKTTVYNPVLVARSYPTMDDGDVAAAGWDPKYNDAWNGNYIYRNTSPSNPKELMKVELNNKTGVKGGRGTVTVGSKKYNVKHVTKDNLIAENGRDTLRAKLVAGTGVNKGRPVMVFLVNGENICGTDSQNNELYCSKIEGEELNNYQDQYQSVGIRKLDMDAGLGIPKVNLNQPNPNPCTNQSNNPITQSCAEFLYYGEAYAPLSSEREQKGCTNKSFFDKTLWPDLQGKDLVYAQSKITQIQQRGDPTTSNPDPNYLRYCKGDNLGKYEGKFIKNKSGDKVYYIYKNISYLIPTHGACYPGDHSSSDIVTVPDDIIKEADEFKSKFLAVASTSTLTLPDDAATVAAICIGKSANGKAITSNSTDSGSIYIVYNGQKYWLPSYGDCGPASESNKVVRYNAQAVSAIPPTGTNYTNMPQATASSKDPDMRTFCQNAEYGTPCPMNTPYVYNADGEKDSYCCSEAPTTSRNTTYLPGTYDSCSSGKNTPCGSKPCVTNNNYTGEAAEAWALDSADNIYTKKAGNTGIGSQSSWKKIPGSLHTIDGTGKEYVWGTNSGGGIYACKKPCNGDWTRVKGEMMQLSVDTQNNNVYGVNRSDAIYWQYANTPGYHWRRIPGVLTNISASGYNWVWGVNREYMIYATEKGAAGPKNSGSWLLVSGALTFVSADNQGTEAASNVYGISPNTHDHHYASIYKHNINPNTGGWTQISTGPGNSSNLNTTINATNRVWLYVTLKNGEVFRALKSDPPMKMRWRQVYGTFSWLTVGNTVPTKMPMVNYGMNMFLRFPALSGNFNVSGRYLSGDRTGGNAAVLVNANSSYESRTASAYTFIATKELYGSTGTGPVKYGDVFGLKCASMGRYVSGSRGDDRGINTEDPSSSNEAKVIKAGQIAMKKNPPSDTGYAWSFVPGTGNKSKRGYPVCYGDQVMLVMSLWQGDALTAFSNNQVHNYPPKSPNGGTNQIVIDMQWGYPNQL